MLSNRQSFLNYAEISTKKNEPNKQTAYSTTSGKPSEAEESNSIKNEIIYSPKRVFKKARKNSSEYKINPDVIPRPSHIEEIYRNPINKSIIYETNEENLPPFTTAFYTVKETENSSPRLIRSSLVKIPLEQEYLNKSNLIFGLNVQPFAELLDDEKSIPIVEVKEDILRCSRCNCYINNKFELKYMINSKKVAICNCCNYIIDLNTNNNIVKSEYMASDLRGIPELSYPSIDFIAPEKFKSNQIFYPNYGIFIDVSPLSIEMGYASYVKTQIIIDKVLNSITSSLESFHNKENSSLFIATYDSSNIHFYLVDNNGDIKVLYIPDIDQPFAPVPKEKILLNISKNKEQIEKIVEKIQYFLSDQRQYFGKSIDGAAVGAAISAGKEVFKYGGGARVLVFCFSPCFSGFGCSKPVDSMNLFNTDKEKLLYIPQNDILTKISLDSVQNEKTVFDLFVIHNQSIDLVNLSQVCNITGGKCHFYTIDNPDDLKLKLEKLHYDLSRVFSRRNYYNVSLKLRSSQEIDIVEIIGPFGRRLGSALSLSGCDPEYSFNFYCKIKDNLKVSQRIHFQLAVIYTDNFNQRFLRILNYTIQGTPDISIMYKSIDVDVMTKLLFCKEISSIINTGFYKLRTELVNKLVTTLIYYRDTSSKGSSQSQLILPECLKYYPLYLNSLFKKPILNKNKTKLTMNCIVDEINSIRRDPVYLSIKYLYPKLYRIDDITEVKPEICHRLGYDKEKMLLNIGGILVETGAVQRPYLHALTIDRICFEGSYLIDTGRYIYLIIFKETNVNFISAVKLIQLNPQSLEDTNENELNIRLVYVLNQIRIDNNGVYQPLKILFIKDNYDTFNELTSNLIEDSYKGELSYIDFLCEIHSSIQCRKPN